MQYVSGHNCYGPETKSGISARSHMPYTLLRLTLLSLGTCSAKSWDFLRGALSRRWVAVAAVSRHEVEQRQEGAEVDNHMARADRLYTIGEAEQLLGVTSKTLRRWIAKASIEKEPDAVDGRVRRLSRKQLAQLAEAHNRALAADGAAVVTSTGRVAASTQRALQARITELEGDVAALRDQVASLLRTPLPRAAAALSPKDRAGRAAQH